MTAAGDLDVMRAQVDAMTRALRRMPKDTRAVMDDSMRKVGDGIARKIDQAAGSVPRPGHAYAVALRRGGIKVSPGRGELKITIGGGTRSGIGRLTMRQIVGGAEFGARGRTTTYRQRRKHGTATVTRRVTRQFGRWSPDGRFIYPTWNREQGPALTAWADAVDRALDGYWQGVADA